jgi:hypothetical protein
MAQIIRDFISSKAPKKAKDPKYMEDHYKRWKAWILMYNERCTLVHGGFEEMENPQEIWDAPKYIEQDMRGDVAMFSDPTWPQYVLDAIDEMRTYKFVVAGDGSVT